MKKILFLLLISTLSVKSQNLISIGFTNGLSYSSLVSTSNDKYFASLPTYVLGATFEYEAFNRVSFVGNVLYETKGCKGTDMKVVSASGVKQGLYSFEYRADYLMIPLLVKYSIGEYKGFFIEGGPYMGCLINYAEKFKTIGQVDRTQDMKKLDMGMTLGMGFVIPIQETFLILEIRENLGFTNIVNGVTYTGNRPAFIIDNAKTRSLNLLVGFKYTLN